MVHDVPYYLVDANVWLSYFFPNRDGHEASSRFIRAAIERDCQLLHSPMIIRDVFYLACNQFKRAVRAEKGALTETDARIANQISWSFVNTMREISTAVGIDETDIWLALKWRPVNADFEDNLVRAAVERVDADLLVTWDKHLLSRAFVPTVTPEDALRDLLAR